MSVGILRGMRDRIECMRVRPLLQPLLDGELDAAGRARMETYLEACRRCGLAADTYEALKARLRQFEQPVHPAAVERLEAFVTELVDEPDDGPPQAG
jgi:anti-sigma factor RsiW